MSDPVSAEPAIRIACAADANYLPHVATLLASIGQTHAAGEVGLHFLHLEDMPPASLHQLTRYARGLGIAMQCHCIASQRVAALPAMGRISRVMWLRLFLPEVLPDADRVLYLDCDTLVCTHLGPLWQLDLKDHGLGAVANVFERGWESHATRQGLARPQDYFNSGVLLMNLRIWREQELSQRLLALSGDPTAGLVWPDQDALNRIFAQRWMPLHPRWNCQNSLFFFPQAADYFSAEELARARREPGILHFEGGMLAKPWHFLCKNPWRKRYLGLRATTPWPLRRREGATLLHLLLRPLPFATIVQILNFQTRVQRKLNRAFVRSGG